MIPNLPRPLLWTEIKTMREFLNGDFLTSMLYNIFKSIQETFFIPHVNEVSFFNELYYQLTRYYYEKPDSNDYHRYYADIRSNLGMVECADLVMTMMYHYCRLRDHQFVFRMDSFMQTVQLNQYPGVYWRYFETSTSSVIRWIDVVPYPQKPCPVSPASLIKKGLNWKRITHEFNLETLKEILSLWEKEDDKKNIASIFINYVTTIKEYNSEKIKNVLRYLTQVTSVQDDMSTSMLDDNNRSDNKEFDEAAKFISEYNRKKVKWGEDENANISKPTPRVIVTSRTSKGGMTHTTFKIVDEKTQDKSKDESEIKDKEIVQLKKERDEYKKKVDDLEKRIKELEKKHEEDEASMLAGHGALVLEEIEAGKVVSRELLNTDVNQALAESQRQNKLSQQQLKEMESQIANLRDKLGNTTIPLKSLAEGIKRYAKLYGLEKGKGLLLSLSFILKKEHVWTDNAESLENFFINAEEENKKKHETTNIEQQTVFHNVGTYNNTVKEQNNNFPSLPLGPQGEKQLE